MSFSRQFKSKIKDIPSFRAEDSSDYMSSDVEMSSSGVDLATAASSANNLPSVSSSHKDVMNDDSMDSYSNDQSYYSSATNRKVGSTYKSAYETPSRGGGSSYMGDDSSQSRLTEVLDYLHRMICRKDKDGIFELPVTDDIAPGYSLIIARPMDLSTMRKKIDSHEYATLKEYRDDLILMCENCMTYNKPDTIYHHAARKMLDYGLKLLCKDKLASLRNTVRIMRYLTPSDIGFSLDGDSHSANEPPDPSPQLIRKRAEQTQQKTFSSASNLAAMGILPPVMAFDSSTLAGDSSKSKTAKVEVFVPRDSFLLPPDGQDIECDVKSLTSQVKKIAAEAAMRLKEKNSEGKLGYLRRNTNGTTCYNYLKNSGPSPPLYDEENPKEEPKQDDENEEEDGEEEEEEEDDENESSEQSSERPLTIGSLLEGLQPNSWTMSNYIEEKKNKSSAMYFVENGPFSSHAPQADTSYAALTKEEAEILLTLYGDETAYQYALSLMEFGKGTGFMFNKYVNLVLNTMTANEHEKYLKYLKDKQDREAAATSAASTQKVEPVKTESTSSPLPPTNDTTSQQVENATNNIEENSSTPEIKVEANNDISATTTTN